MKPRYRLYWSLFDHSWACFHADDLVKRDGHFLVGPLLAYCYAKKCYMPERDANGNAFTYSQL